MAQVPELPITEAVGLPQAKPALFGSGEGAVSDLAYESGQTALEGQALEEHLAYAHRQLQAKQAEIAIDAYMNNVYAELNKQTTVEGVQEVLHHAQDPQNVGPLLAPYGKDHRLGQMVHLAWQQAQVGLQHDANTHTAHIITEGTKSADALNKDKTIGQAVAVAGAGGDDDTVGVFRDRYEMNLRNGVSAGVYTPQDVDRMMHEWNQDFMKDLALVGMGSPDESTRKRTISELKAGGGHFSKLDPATRTALYDEALAKNEHLTNLQESADYDAASAHFKQETKGLSLDQQMQLANNDEWAVTHGFADENGNPKRKVLDKISEDINRQQIWQHKIQGDKDSEIVDKYMTDVDEGRLSDRAIDQLVIKEGGSPKAATQLKTLNRESLREKLELGSLSIQARTLRMNELKDRGDQISLQVWNKIIQTGQLDYDKDIQQNILNKNMTASQGNEIFGAYKRVLEDPDYKSAVALINASSLPNKEKAEAYNKFTGMYIKNNYNGPQAIDQAQKLIDDTGKGAAKKSTWDAIGQWWTGNFGGGSAPKTAPVTPPSVPKDAAGKMKFTDGKKHYVDVNGKDLGVAE